MLNLLPNVIILKIFSYLDICVKKNNHYLVSKLFLKLIKPEECNPIKVFNKVICYTHNKKTLEILSIDFGHCISHT